MTAVTDANLQPGAAVSDPNLQPGAAVSAGGGAELLELASRTDAELSGGSPGQPGQAPAPPAIPLERELAGLFEMMGVAAGHFLPSVKTVLNDEACKQLGDALAPVARKYGLERYLAGFAWRVELHALVVAGPIALALIAAVKHDLAQLRSAQRAAERGAGLGAEIPAAAAPSSPPPAPPAEMLQPLEAAA